MLLASATMNLSLNLLIKYLFKYMIKTKTVLNYFYCLKFDLLIPLDILDIFNIAKILRYMIVYESVQRI